jgi:hypothetical protein
MAIVDFHWQTESLSGLGPKRRIALFTIGNRQPTIAGGGAPLFSLRPSRHSSRTLRLKAFDWKASQEVPQSRREDTEHNRKLRYSHPRCRLTVSRCAPNLNSLWL